MDVICYSVAIRSPLRTQFCVVKGRAHNLRETIDVTTISLVERDARIELLQQCNKCQDEEIMYIDFIKFLVNPKPPVVRYVSLHGDVVDSGLIYKDLPV